MKIKLCVVSTWWTVMLKVEVWLGQCLWLLRYHGSRTLDFFQLLIVSMSNSWTYMSWTCSASNSDLSILATIKEMPISRLHKHIAHSLDCSLPKTFYLLHQESNLPRKCPAWDPWPVRYFRPDVVAARAFELLKNRNINSIDNFIDRIEMLPASGYVDGVQGGEETLRLYSLRSPSRLPVLFHLWMRPDKKLMSA